MSRIRKAIIARVERDAAMGNATDRRAIIALHKALRVPRRAVLSALKSMTASASKTARHGQLWSVRGGKVEFAVAGVSRDDWFDGSGAISEALGYAAGAGGTY